MSEFHSFKCSMLNGDEMNFESLKNKTVLIVNTASQCGFTPQYADLQNLYDTYRDKGLEIIAFPCNQFGKQEPGSAQEIKTFCETNFNINFPIAEKVEVNGVNAHPLYKYLKEQKSGLLGSKKIKWNFTKFVIDTKGEVVERFAPPLDIKKLTLLLDKLTTGLN